ALRSGDATAAAGLVERHISWVNNLARGEER
ncbi:GntR family transcriptional regulator, partial [Streptomyces sp. MCAF7]